MTERLGTQRLQIHFDWKIFAFTAGITSHRPALRPRAGMDWRSRAEIAARLKETCAERHAPPQGRSGKALVAFQIASLHSACDRVRACSCAHCSQLSSVDVGFAPIILLLVRDRSAARRYPAGKDVAFTQRLEQRFAAFQACKLFPPRWTPYVADDHRRLLISSRRRRRPRTTLKQQQRITTCRQPFLSDTRNSHPRRPHLRSAGHSRLAQGRNHQPELAQSGFPD